MRYAATLCIPLAAAPAIAQPSPAEFYRGKTIDLFIGYPPGGGYDIYGRALAQYMGKYLPGNPQVVARNMPGASSLKAVQHIAQTAPRDGTALAAFNSNLFTMALTDPRTVNIDFGALPFVGNMVSVVKTCFSWRASGVTRVDELREKTLILGGTARGSGYIYGSLLQQAYGAERVKIVLGYPSNVDAYMAMERGELMGNCTGHDIVRQLRPQWFRDNSVSFLVQYAETPEPGLEGVPRIFDLPISEDMKKAARFYIAADRVVRPIVTTPSAPPDRVDALREAFDKAMVDPELRDAARKQNMDLQPMTGREAARLAAQIRATPADIVAIARKLEE